MTQLNRFFVFALLLTNSWNLAKSQVTGEWILQDYPESQISDVCVQADGRIHIVVHSIHDLEDTTQYDYTTHIIKISFDEDGEVTLTNVFSKNTDARRFVSNRLDNVQGDWIYAESTWTDQMVDTFSLTRFDMNFVIVRRWERVINSELFSYSSLVSENDKYTGIGSLGSDIESLVGVSFSSDAPDTVEIKVFKTIPAVGFTTSLTYDNLRNRFLIFHLGGIALFSDTFGLIQSYPAWLLNTGIHGTVLVDDLRYLSFGQSIFEEDIDVRDLLFQQYDTSMNILFVDTLGRPGKDDYPFINQSIDKHENHFYVGGMLASPSEIRNNVPIKFFLAKYNQEMDHLWYKEFGGNHTYRISGLSALPDGRCLVYGWRRENDSGLRYPYLLIADEDGEITSIKRIPDLDETIIQILYSGKSGFLTIDVHKELKYLHLLAIDGKPVLRYNDLFPGHHEFDLSFLPPGVYICLAKSKQGEIQTIKWMKE